MVVAGLALAVAGVAFALSRGATPNPATASSHREAPLIAEDPTADNTDLYAFRSPDRPGYLTVISNWQPAQDPGAGPNYYRFSSTARYNIKIDRDGDARPDMIYQFQFKNRPGQFFLGNTVQDYTVRLIQGRRSRVIARGATPPNNIGPRTTPKYDAKWRKQIRGLPGGGRVFAGQREDPFFADIGAIFDLVAIRKGVGNQGGGKDFFAGYGVSTIAIQIPIGGLKAKNDTVGIWSSTDRQTMTTRGTGIGAYRQVSRLGNPLVNEVVIPTALKDGWNRGQPVNDKAYAKFGLNPILAAVINKLYPSVNAPEHDRDDLGQVFLTGVPKLNFTGPTLADMLRVNLSIAPKPVGRGNRLGVLAGDTAGGGRRAQGQQGAPG
jgi:hypothetical protein